MQITKDLCLIGRVKTMNLDVYHFKRGSKIVTVTMLTGLYLTITHATSHVSKGGKRQKRRYDFGNEPQWLKDVF